MLFGRRERRDVESISVVQFARHQRRAVQQLIGRADSIHTHLDWFETEHWLEDAPPLTWVAYQGTRAVGFLGLGPPLDGASWVRLAVVDDGYAPEEVLGRLWERATGALAAHDVKRVALLVINAWVTPYFEPFGFHRFDEVITMRRSSREIPNITSNEFQVRPLQPNELAAVIDVDQAAFAAPWKMSGDEIRQAASMAASVTVATQDGLIIGYQLSTLYFDGAHLARLAVLPSFQGHGVGTVLLHDLLLRFAQRGVYAFTVNTQETNIQSQRLYHHFAFKRNGYDLPVYVYEV
ncbi:MAG: GNAT family N-acetyltransferase [Anaerolineae bacterium]|nr:GNAT family N-acetyltransferase [Anaerolineae bacterium]